MRASAPRDGIPHRIVLSTYLLTSTASSRLRAAQRGVVQRGSVRGQVRPVSLACATYLVAAYFGLVT